MAIHLGERDKGLYASNLKALLEVLCIRQHQCPHQYERPDTDSHVEKSWGLYSVSTSNECLSLWLDSVLHNQR